MHLNTAAIWSLFIFYVAYGSTTQYSQDKIGNKVFLELSSQLRGNLQKTENLNKGMNLMQLSNDGSGDNEDGLDDDTKVLTVFLLNIIACIVCCGFIQLVLMLSKRMNNELSVLRKNYKQYQGFLRFKEFRKAYAKDQEATSSDN